MLERPLMRMKEIDMTITTQRIAVSLALFRHWPQKNHQNFLKVFLQKKQEFTPGTSRIVSGNPYLNENCLDHKLKAAFGCVSMSKIRLYRHQLIRSNFPRRRCRYTGIRTLVFYFPTLAAACGYEHGPECF